MHFYQRPRGHALGDLQVGLVDPGMSGDEAFRSAAGDGCDMWGSGQEFDCKRAFLRVLMVPWCGGTAKTRKVAAYCAAASSNGSSGFALAFFLGASTRAGSWAGS